MGSFDFRKVALAAILCAVMAPLSMATPVGTISFGISNQGGAFGSNNFIDWYLPAGCCSFGDSVVGSGSVTYSGGVITGATNPFARLADLPVTALALLPGTPFSNFIQFYTPGSHDFLTPGSGSVQTNPAWDILGVGPPAAVDCATDPGVNVPCSIHVAASNIGPYVSPLILTRNNSGGSDVRLDFLLLGRDATGSVIWTGLATANVSSKTPLQIATDINNGLTVDVRSWSLDITAIPEPSAFALALAGFSMIGIGVIRRRRQ
jgi:hypothetical protein